MLVRGGAVVNYIKLRLLKPVHKWAASVLVAIPMDGTFDQSAPLRRLVGRRDCFSYDLSAETDGWPLLIIFEIFAYLFDRSFDSSLLNSALATNVFLLPFVKLKWSQVCFVAGLRLLLFLATFRIDPLWLWYGLVLKRCIQVVSLRTRRNSWFRKRLITCYEERTRANKKSQRVDELDRRERIRKSQFSVLE